jgi:hypothetical protein
LTKVSIDSSDPFRLSVNDHSKELAYYALSDSVITPQALLVLLPGLGESPHQVFTQTTLAQQAAQSGIITIVPSINNRIYLDAPSRAFLDKSINKALQRYKIAPNKVVIGGFSAGGHLALAYTAHLHQDSSKARFLPQAVFGIDPAVDLTNLWERAERMAKNNPNKANGKEGNRILKALHKEGNRILMALQKAFGGSPGQYPQKYLAYSPFTKSNSQGGNAHYLVKVPLRLYCEPDMDFWKQLSLEYKDLNADSGEAMIDFLQKAGNAQAQFIKTRGKGFRGGMRFPHAWTIVDAAECIGWLKSHLE